MQKVSLKEAVKRLRDQPLTAAAEELFVNRKEEMLVMVQNVDYFSGNIIGVAGERGIGKTTLFNLVRFPGKEKIIINIVDRESKAGVISNIIDGIIEYAGRKGFVGIEGKGKELIKKVLALTTFSLAVGSASISMRKKEMKTLRSLVKELGDIVEEIAAKVEVVIILDEIDKERKEELLLVVDSIKDAFKENKATLIVALPYEIYEMYMEGVVSAKETYNLDNVFDQIMLIPPLTDEDIKEVILRRVSPSLVEEKALNLMALYSMGNPRRAVRLVKEAGMVAASEGKIKEKHVRVVCKKYLQYLYKSLGLSESDIKIIKLIEKGKDIKYIAKYLSVSLPTAYRKAQNLSEKGLVGEDRKGLTKLGKVFSTFY